jgi:quercetin dioxygenase-like cupin family protein
MRRMLVASALLLALPALLPAQVPAPPTGDAMRTVSANAVTWAALQPEGFDPGLELAIINGDPAVADQPYTVRLRFKDGYRFPAHFHPRPENVTVLKGTFLLGMGDTASENVQQYGPGDYLYLPPNQPHYGGATGETEVQLHGIGPFEIKLAKPALK